MRFSKFSKTGSLAILMGSMLVACGGGGGSASPSPVPPVSVPPVTVPPVPPVPATGYALPGVGSANYAGPQGVFDAPNGTFDPVVTILDTGEVYGIDLIGSRVAGMFHGAVSGSASQISGPALTEYNSVDGNLLQAASLTANYSAPDLALTLKFPFGTFASTGHGQKPYAATDSRAIYDNPLPLANLAAGYQGVMTLVGTTLSGDVAVTGMQVQADGGFTFKVDTCDISGKFAAHGSKGVFDAQATVSGTACPANGAMKGIMLPLSVSAGTTRLAFYLIKLDGSSAAVLLANKN
jgi:hypothetical protein